MDNRIGFFDSTGRRVLPERTVGGHPVKRPVTGTVGLVPGKYFAVLDTFVVPRFEVELAALKAEAAALSAPETPDVEVLPAEIAPESVPVKRGKHAG